MSTRDFRLKSIEFLTFLYENIPIFEDQSIYLEPPGRLYVNLFLQKRKNTIFKQMFIEKFWIL